MLNKNIFKYKNTKISIQYNQRINLKSKIFKKKYQYLIIHINTFVFFTTYNLKKKINIYINTILKIFLNLGLNISINNFKIIKYKNNIIKFYYLGFIFFIFFQKYKYLNNILKQNIYIKTKKFFKTKLYLIYPNLLKLREIKYYIYKIVKTFFHKNIYEIIKNLNSMSDSKF